MNPLLAVEHLTVTYDHSIPVLKDIQLTIGHREIVAIVGESGCGKTTLLKTMIHTLPANAQITEGQIYFNGKDLRARSNKEWRKILGCEIAVIFQNPSAFFSPIMKIKQHFIRSIQSHQVISKQDALQKSRLALQKMHFATLDIERILTSYPFELSGGMMQRVAIALAMVLKPKLLLADEPTSALDVITQHEILKAFVNIRDEFNTSIFMITHNLRSAAQIADRIVVMSKGQIVECAPTKQLFSSPQSDYTKKLLDAIPSVNEVVT